MNHKTPHLLWEACYDKGLDAWCVREVGDKKHLGGLIICEAAECDCKQIAEDHNRVLEVDRKREAVNSRQNTGDRRQESDEQP